MPSKVGQGPKFRRVLSPGARIPSRDEALVEMCRAENVVHIGCVDTPFTEEKLASQDLLHVKLLRHSRKLVGVDIDSAGLEIMQSHVGGDYICLDLSSLGDGESELASNPSALFGFAPKLYVLGDVIEHLDNPVALLKSVGILAAETDAQVLITTPNALALRTTLNTTLGYELMHPDHVLVHTLRTLEQLLSRADLVIDWLGYYTIQTGVALPHKVYDLSTRIASRIRPAWGDGLIAICSKRNVSP